jgi:gamma-glutamyltranspeptidase/glutathione hydrolase
MDGSRPVVSSVAGVVAAAHPLAASAGARVLWAGGNAFDAAAAVAAALGVVEPFMSGLAGGGMATVYVAREGRVRSLMFRALVPRGFPVGRFSARAEMLRGAMTVTGPANLAGWCALLEAYGTKSLAEVLAPAMALARDGFPMTRYNVAGIAMTAGEMAKQPGYAAWNAAYAGGRGAVRQGEVLAQRDLAATFEAIAAEGPGYLYGGRLGQAIVDHVASLGGCLSMEDILDCRPEWVEPVAAGYRGLEVCATPLPSQAFQYLLALRLLDGVDLRRMERDGVEHLDAVWRAIRLSAGERIRLGRGSPEAVAEVLGEASVARLRARLGDGVPVEGPTEQWIAPPPVASSAEKPKGQHTTSLSVADRWGNVVCLTQSLGALFGSGIVVPGTGVCLNNALYWGELDPRGPNALIPGGQLMGSTAPSIALKGGRPVLALGTPGSYGITQTQVQALVQHVDFGLGIQAAIEAPRARLWDGRRVQAESRIRASVLEGLAARGHGVEIPGPWTLAVGGMQGIAIDPETGVMTGGADPRREGYAVAV